MKKLIYFSLITLAALVAGAATFVADQTPAKPKPKTTKAKPKAKAKSKTAEVKKDSVIVWYSPTEGYAKAKKEKKILLVDVYTDWCYWCKVMDKQTYTNKDIIEKVNQYFVAVKFNPENNGNHNINGQMLSSNQLMQLLVNGGHNSGYPTTYFWKKLEDNTTISGYPGYREPAPFNEILNTWVNK